MDEPAQRITVVKKGGRVSGDDNVVVAQVVGDLRFDTQMNVLD